MFQITVVAANVVMVAAASGDAIRNLKPHMYHQILVTFVVIVVLFFFSHDIWTFIVAFTDFESN